MNDKSVVENRVEENSVHEVSGEHVGAAVTSEKEGESSCKTSEGKGRQKHKCPYPSCSAKVVHLPRHMRQKHKWDEEDAVGVLNMFGLRAERKRTSTKGKRVHKKRMCPIDGCRSVVKRIHNHLTDVHNKKRGSKEYKYWLKMAVIYQGKDISESSESTPDSSSSEDVKETSGRRKYAKTHKPKERREFYKQVYSSDEEGFGDEYPSIFQNQTVEQETLANSPTLLSEKDPSCSHQIESRGDEVVLSDEFDGEFVDDDYDDDDGEDDDDDDGEFVDDDDLDDDKKDDKDETETPRSQQEMFKHFREWLQGADGGRKEEHVANQCSRQVEMVLEYIDRENRDLKNILTKRILRDKWLTPFEKEKRPGTVKSYLASLNHFYIFAKCEKPDGVAATEEQLSLLSEQVKLWNKSIQRLVKGRFWEKRMDDLSSLRKPEQIKAFDLSTVAREAVKVLGKFQDKSSVDAPSNAEYTLVRDYLLTLLCINNGSRAGVLSNMTLSEFNKAKQEDGCFVVQVKKHKTFTAHGPASVVMTPSVHQWMLIFICKFRSSVENASNEGTAEVFLALSGRPMKASDVGSQIGSCWEKVFGKGSGAGGATAFRKAVVSAVHRNDAGQRENLANLMEHNKSTADKYYLLADKTKTAAKTSTYVCKLMHSGELSDPNAPTTSQAQEHPTNNASENSFEEFANPTASRENTLQTSRRKWTSEENAAIKSVFASCIEAKSITMREVKDLASNHQLLRSISPSKIRDKVRSFFGENPPIPLAELPCESPRQRLARVGLCKANVDQPTVSVDIKMCLSAEFDNRLEFF